MIKRKFFPLSKPSKASPNDDQRKSGLSDTSHTEGKDMGETFKRDLSPGKNSKKKNGQQGFTSLMNLNNQMVEEEVHHPKETPKSKPNHSSTPKKNESLSDLQQLYKESPVILFDSRRNSNNNETPPHDDVSSKNVTDSTTTTRSPPVTIPKLDLTNSLGINNQYLQMTSPRASSSPRNSPRSSLAVQSRSNVSPLVPPLKNLPQPTELSLSRPRTSSPRSGRSSDRKNIIEKIIRQNTLFDQNNTESYEWNSFCFNITSHKSNLKELRLKKCGLKDVEHASPLFKCLMANQVKLKILDLEDNNITKASMSHLSEYLLVASESLQFLSLRKNQITDEGISCLTSSFKGQENIVLSLEEIDLSSNHISDEGLTFLTSFAKYHTPYLATIKCFDNSITNINILRSLINDEDKNYLRNIDLWKNSIQLEGLARFTTIATKITSLNLGCNSLSDKGVIVISKYLSFCKSLKCLDLSGNDITDSGGFHMANALLVNQGLVMLNMSNNNMGEEACVKLLESIKNHATLCNFNLCRNRLSPNSLIDLTRFVSDINAARKKTGYPICKAFMSPLPSILTPRNESSLIMHYSPRFTLSSPRIGVTAPLGMSPSLHQNEQSMEYVPNGEERTPPHIVRNNFLNRASHDMNTCIPQQSNNIILENLHLEASPRSTLNFETTTPIATQSPSSLTAHIIDTTTKSGSTQHLNGNSSSITSPVQLQQPGNTTPMSLTGSNTPQSSALSKNGHELSRASNEKKRKRFKALLLYAPKEVALESNESLDITIKFSGSNLVIRKQKTLLRRRKTLFTLPLASTTLEQNMNQPSIFFLFFNDKKFSIKFATREEEFRDMFNTLSKSLQGVGASSHDNDYSESESSISTRQPSIDVVNWSYRSSPSTPTFTSSESEQQSPKKKNLSLKTIFSKKKTPHKKLPSFEEFSQTP
ncbi:hypothetical protein C9374_004006 [Naegleria lovaniensis]|uniref:Leucine-rich repeat-containing protein n=1 Tax=Naegleria lovaniensis TaxID=51637 RepID=A0AA88H960_NAELO|nr:uncharacterized protein C9374_004006 [Naegleria lovaniensis]KAG2394242.1 hypothetical protein C9374_004006 [Naegleria lovaniensis]